LPDRRLKARQYIPRDDGRKSRIDEPLVLLHVSDPTLRWRFWARKRRSLPTSVESRALPVRQVLGVASRTGAPVPFMWRWGFSPGLWYTFPGGGFVRIVITLLPAILMVVSFSVPIHAISAFDVVQFVAQSALATDDWQTQYWIGYDENNPRCFDNGYCVWEAMSPADPEWWRHNVQFTRAAYAILPNS